MRVLRVVRTPPSFPPRQPCAGSVFNQSPLCSCPQPQERASRVRAREGALGREAGPNWAFSRRGPFLPALGSSKFKL